MRSPVTNRYDPRTVLPRAEVAWTVLYLCVIVSRRKEAVEVLPTPTASL